MREARIGIRLDGRNISCRPITRKALHIICPKWTGQMCHQRIRHTLFRRRRRIVIRKQCRFAWLGMRVADTLEHGFQLRRERHLLQLFIEEEILDAHKQHIVICELLPRKLARFDQRHISLTRPKKLTYEKGSVGFSKGGVIAAWLNILILQSVPERIYGWESLGF